MRKLLLLDADVVLDLHTLGLFGKIKKAYDVYVTRTVFEEAKYYKNIIFSRKGYYNFLKNNKMN